MIALLLWLSSLAPAAVCPQAAPASQAPAASDLARAAELYRAGQHVQAETLLRAWLQRAPQDGEACALLGTVLSAQRRYADAAEAFERATRLLPPNAVLFVNLAVARFESQQLAGARAACEQALALDAGDSRAQLFLARIAVQEGDFARAERAFVAALAAPKVEPLAWYHRGVFLRQERRLDEAVAALQRAVELTPAVAGAHLNLGLALQQLGKPAEAEPHLARFRQLSEIQTGEQALRARLNQLLRGAQRDLEGGNTQAALAALEQAQSAAPDQPLVYELRSLVYARLGRTAESEAQARQARALRERTAPPKR